MLKKKKNYKILIGILLGIALVFIIKQFVKNDTFAAGTYVGAGSEISYDNTNSGLSSTTVQDALDEIYEAKQQGCIPNHLCVQSKTLALGDYVSYTPSVTSATTNPNKTGYKTNTSGTFTASVQTFNPSELNLWRVININQDGSVEIISAYVSSATIYFAGLTGHLNLVGYLNELAGYYETTGITSGHRHFGYSNQIQYLTSSSLYTTASTPPWLCDTGGSCSPAPVESQGGGDNGYLTDYNQLKTAFATSTTAEAAKAQKVGTSTATAYWMASRYYLYNSTTYYRWGGRSVNTRGAASRNYLYQYNNGFKHNEYGFALRPIVTLKSGLSYFGVGTEDDPVNIAG